LLEIAAGSVGQRSPALRAQAVDSLGLIGDKHAVPALIECLSDERTVSSLPAAERAMRRAVEAMGGDLLKKGIDPKALATAPAPTTVADLAARALERITGESLGFRSTDSADRKAAAVRMYRQWWETYKVN
jgi:HEAT repeat protein